MGIGRDFLASVSYTARSLVDSFDAEVGPTSADSVGGQLAAVPRIFNLQANQNTELAPTGNAGFRVKETSGQEVN